MINQKECKKTIPLTIASKIIKYTHINFIKEVKGIEEDMNKWNDIMHSWIKRLNTVQHPYFSKQSTDSRQYLSKCL